MRAATPGLALTLLMLSAPVAMAAPTCLNARGDMARCGTTGAMPLGWTPPAGSQVGRATGEADASDDGKLIGLTAFLAGLFALIALMPDFEDSWDRQGGDDDLRG
jgi:hypothetical protein